MDFPNKPRTFEEVRDAVLDVGTFKYIQIIMKDKKTGQEKTVVRGWSDCGYHADVLNKFQTLELKDYQNSVMTDCPGGGRIEHLPEEKKITIYGYSQGFGKADHSLSQSIIEKDYKNYFISWNNEGY